MCVKPLVLLDMLKETTVLVIEFSIRKGNCCLHFRIIAEPPMSAMLSYPDRRLLDQKAKKRHA